MSTVKFVARPFRSNREIVRLAGVAFADVSPKDTRLLFHENGIIAWKRKIKTQIRETRYYIGPSSQTKVAKFREFAAVVEGVDGEDGVMEALSLIFRVICEFCAMRYDDGNGHYISFTIPKEDRCALFSPEMEKRFHAISVKYAVFVDTEARAVAVAQDLARLLRMVDTGRYVAWMTKLMTQEDEEDEDSDSWSNDSESSDGYDADDSSDDCGNDDYIDEGRARAYSLLGKRPRTRSQEDQQKKRRRMG